MAQDAQSAASLQSRAGCVHADWNRCPTCQRETTLRAQMWRALVRRRVVHADEAAALKALRDRVEWIRPSKDFRGVVLGILRRPITQPRRTRIVPIAARVGRDAPDREI